MPILRRHAMEIDKMVYSILRKYVEKDEWEERVSLKDGPIHLNPETDVLV